MLEQYLYKPQDKANACFDCSRNIEDCPWLHEEKPVPGWTAKPVPIRINHTAARQWDMTYHIRKEDCPLYLPPKRRGTIDEEDEA